MTRALALTTAMLAILIGACTVATPAGPGGSTAVTGASTDPTVIPATPVSTATATAPMSPPPQPVAEVLPPDLDPDLAGAIKSRMSYGLRYDLDYVRQVATDPRASEDAYGWPVYPEEFEDAQGRFDEDYRVQPIVIDYTSNHADEFGGIYLDEATHAGVVTLWSGHIAEHAAAIRAAVGPDARVAFGEVPYPEAELRRIQDEIDLNALDSWARTIPASIQGLGVDIKASQAVLDVSSANPDAPALIEEHLGYGDRLRVDSDGTGAALLPRGTVKGHILPLDGVDRQNLSLQWTSADPGDCGSGDIGYGIDEHGHFEVPCQVGSRTFIVFDIGPNGGNRERGRATIDVAADTTARVTITLH